MSSITEIQIIPIKPQNGLIGFASVVVDNKIYLGSIGIMSKIYGGYRLAFPTKKVGSKSLNIYYPISKEFAEELTEAIVNKVEEIFNVDNE